MYCTVNYKHSKQSIAPNKEFEYKESGISGADENATVREYLVWPAESPRKIEQLFTHLNNLNNRQEVHWKNSGPTVKWRSHTWRDGGLFFHFNDYIARRTAFGFLMVYAEWLESSTRC